MAHAYTPGLRITGNAVVRRERRLPLKGRVLVAEGVEVAADTVVARAELPGNVHTVNVAAGLSIDPARAVDSLVRPIGATVRKGETLAVGKSLFGLVKSSVVAPADGSIENVSNITGQLILREPPIPVEVNAYVRGVVAAVMPDEGVVIQTRVALLQGIFGVGGETFGEIAIACATPDEALTPAQLSPEHRGRIVIGGAHVSHAALMRARELGVAAVVVGGFDDQDLRLLLGRDLGVAITGSEDLGLTLVLTEGFGHIRMAERTWKLFQAHVGALASVSGATQIRAGVMRPEVLIPLGGVGTAAPAGEDSSGLAVGSLVRVIREPHFGRIGEVVDLPAELMALESEAQVRVLVVEFADDRARSMVPRANVELIAE